MSQETIQFMMTKILRFETFENRIIDLETKNVELESNLKIVQNQLENLTQNSNVLLVKSDPETGANFTEEPYENAVLSNLDDQIVFNHHVHHNSNSTVMDTILTGSQDVNIENQNSNFAIEGIKSEGIEWSCTSTMINQNVEIIPASSSSLITPFSSSRGKKIKILESNRNLLLKISKIPKIHQNAVIPLIRVDSDPNFKYKYQNEIKSGQHLRQGKFTKTKSDTSSKLTIHGFSSSQSRNYRCKICSKFFKSKSTFDDHLKVECKCRNKTVECSICLKKFTTLAHLKLHNRIHTGEKPYSCSVCPKKFYHSTHLTDHIRTHTGEKPYICKFCPKIFASNSTLRQHIRTHTGEKPYICKLCPKKFSQNSSLTVHRRLHTGERPYSCKFCPKKFTCSSHLLKHSRNHTEEKSYSCLFCPEKFCQQKSLNDHTRSHTTGEKPYILPEKICS